MSRHLCELALSVSLLVVACDSGGHHHAPPIDPTIHEIEPNGTAFTANGIGPIRPGDYFPIRGHVTDFGPDFFDGFAFVSDVPLEVEFVLTADHPVADLDLCVFDPFLGEFVACFETPWNPEVGFVTVFEPGVEFHLVVSSFRGSSGYSLEVLGHPLCCPIEATENERLRPSEQAVESKRDAFWRAYAPVVTARASEPATEASPVRGVVVSIDPHTGTVEERPYLRSGHRAVVLGE